MSRSKESFGGAGHRWRNATRAMPCPVCGGDSWCSIRADGAFVACRRQASEHAKTDTAGLDYWVHRTGEADGPVAISAAPLVSSTDRATPARRSDVYRALLEQLSLSAAHRLQLEQRGLDSASIAEGGYRSLELSGRAALAKAVAERSGAPDGVPGFYVAEKDGRSWLSLGGSPGLVVPVRDSKGRILALKIRRDEKGEGSKYSYLSSASHEGPSAELAVHVPLGVTSAELVHVTEGELKADVATKLSGIATISVPGVGAWKLALPVLKQLGAKRVRVAFDADFRTKREVATAARCLLLSLREKGYATSLLTWELSEGKGLDDMLLARLKARAA